MSELSDRPSGPIKPRLSVTRKRLRQEFDERGDRKVTPRRQSGCKLGKKSTILFRGKYMFVLTANGGRFIFIVYELFIQHPAFFSSTIFIQSDKF